MISRLMICCVILPIALSCGRPSGSEAQALGVLKKVAGCDDFWVQVHAIEYMAALNYHKEATALIAAHLHGNDTIPQKRIGVWRASYLSSPTDTAAKRFLNQILQAYVDTAGPDRVHAVETLAKLGYSLKGISHRILESDSISGGMLAAFVNWGKAIPADNESLPDYDALLRDLTDDDAEKRKLAAFGLGYLGKHSLDVISSQSQPKAAFPEDKWQQLYALALKEDSSSVAYPYLLSTTYSLYDFKANRFEDQLVTLHSQLINLQYQQNKSSRIELCRALAIYQLPGDEKILEGLINLNHPITDTGIPGIEYISTTHPWNQDVQAAAAFAILSPQSK